MSSPEDKKVVEHYPPPRSEEPASPATGGVRRTQHPIDELPPPTFRQALFGYGSIILALVVLGVLVGVLMKVLR
jgi:hypothetical protein